MSELSLLAVIVVSGMTASGKGTLIAMLRAALASRYATQVLGSSALRKALGVTDPSRAALRQAVLKSWGGDHAMPFRLLFPQIEDDTKILILDGARHPWQLALVLEAFPGVLVLHLDVTREFNLRLAAVMTRDEIDHAAALQLLKEEAEPFPCVNYAALAPFAHRHCYNEGGLDILAEHANAVSLEIDAVLADSALKNQHLKAQRELLRRLKARYGQVMLLDQSPDQLVQFSHHPFYAWNAEAACPAS